MKNVILYYIILAIFVWNVVRGRRWGEATDKIVSVQFNERAGTCTPERKYYTHHSLARLYREIDMPRALKFHRVPTYMYRMWNARIWNEREHIFRSNAITIPRAAQILIPDKIIFSSSDCGEGLHTMLIGYTRSLVMYITYIIIMKSAHSSRATITKGG